MKTTLINQPNERVTIVDTPAGMVTVNVTDDNRLYINVQNTGGMDDFTQFENGFVVFARAKVNDATPNTNP